MFQVKQNESTASRKRLPILLVDATDGYSGETGVTSPTISISKNGATAASGTGSFVEIGQGQYYYEFASGEIDTLGWVSIYVIKTGTTRAYNAIVQIMAYDYAEGTNLGLSSLPTAAIGATGALLTSYTSNGALDVSATGAVNNVETVVNGVTLAAGTGSSVAQDVWNYDITGIGSTNLAGGALEAAAGGTAGAGCSSAVEIAQEVWNFDITGYYNSDQAGTRLFKAGDYIWATDIDSLGQDIWQANTKLINTVNSVYDANIPGQIIGQNVWNYDTSAMSPGSLAGGYLNDINTWSFTASQKPDETTIANAVWALDITGVAPPYAGGVLNFAATGASVAEVANTVWSTDISAYTSPSAGYELLNAGAGASSALTSGDVEGLRYRLGLNGTATAPSVNGNLGSNTGNLQSVGTVQGNVLGSLIGDVQGNLDGTVNNVNAFSQPAIQSIWQYEEVGIGLTTSIGYRLKTNVDAQISAVDNNVWSYNTGTGASAAAQLNAAAVAGAGSSSALEIAQTVWGLDISGYTSPSAGYELLNAGAGSGGSSAAEIANAVWEANIVGVGDTTSAAVYLTNTLFTAGNIEVYVANQTPQDVWSYSGVEGRTITGGTGVTLATALPSNFSLLSINGSGEVVASNAGAGLTSVTDIAAAVWNYDTYAMTPGSLAGGMLYDTNNYAFAASNKPDETLIASTVWGSDVSGYIVGTAGYDLTQAAIAGSGGSSAVEIAGEVWGYATRDITGGTITTNNDKTGYSLTQAFPTNFATLAINGSGQVTTSNPGTGSSSTTEIAQAVWAFNTGTGASAATQLNVAAIGDSAATAKAVWDKNLLPYFVAGPSDIAGYVTYATMAQTDQIPQNVFDYDPGPYKNTGYASFGGVIWAAATGASAAQNVWTYNTGTGASAAAQLNAAAIAGSGGSSATEVAQAVWAYNTGTGASAAAQLNTAALPGTGSSSYEIANAVWEYIIPYGTYGANQKAGFILGDVIPNMVDNTIGLTTGIGDQVWSSNLVNISLDPIYGPNLAGRYLYDLNKNIGGISSTSAQSIASFVWNYNTGTGASASTQLNTAASAGAGSSASEIAQAVWTYNNGRSITSGTGVTLSPGQVPTNFTTMSIDGSGKVSIQSSDITAIQSGLSTLTAAQVNAEVDTALADVGLTTTVTGRIDAAVSSRLASASAPANFSILSINGSGQVVASNAGTGSTATPAEIAAATWSYASGRTITGGTGVTLATALPSNFSSLNIDGSGKVSVQSADISTIKSGLSTLTQAQVGTEVDSSLSDVGLTTTVTGRIDAAISSRLASASAPVNFSTLAINGSGEVTTSNPGTGASATQIASAVWTANRASIGASDGQFGYYLNAPVSAAGGTVTQVMLGPFALAATDGNNGYLNVYVDDVRPVELVITDENGNAIPLDNNNTHSVLVYDSGSTLVATYTGTVEYEAGGIVSFALDADVTGTAGSYKVVFDIDNGLTISKYGGLTILVKLC